MNRDEALGLLKRGPDGVQEWNRRRDAGEDIPSLEGADLAGADLRGAHLQSIPRDSPIPNEIVDLKYADLRDARLESANISGAFLLGANLKGADLRNAKGIKANLTDANLEGVNFTGAVLPGAIFLRAKLGGAILRDTNLQDASLLDVEGFFGDQLAGAVVAGAKLSDEIKSFGALETIKLACSNARTIFLAMLLGCAYTVLTIGTTTDARIITNSSSSPLPIIGSEIPTVSFYVVAPLILFGFYIYFHLCMQNVWERLGTLPSVLQDGRHLDKATDPWLLLGLVQTRFVKLRDERTFLAQIQALVSIFLAWCVVPLTLFLLWGRYLRAHDTIVTIVHVLSLTAAVAIGIYTYRRAVFALTSVRQPIFSAKRAWRALRCDSAFFTLAVFLLSSAVSAGGFQGWYWNLDIRNAEVSVKPRNWTGNPSNESSEIRQVEPAKLAGSNLRNMRGSGAFLVRADLRHADLREADLSEADMREAKLEGADVSATNFRGTNLKGAKLTRGQISLACLDDRAITSLSETFSLAEYRYPRICEKLWGPRSDQGCR